MEVHGEIEYLREDGVKVHSDICPPNCNSEGLKDKEYRAYLHRELDEWLDKSNGTCGFYIKSEDYEFDYGGGPKID